MDRVEKLIEAMETARIYAGSEFETLCNEKKYTEAELFCMVRDVLKSQITVLKDFETIKKPLE